MLRDNKFFLPFLILITSFGGFASQDQVPAIQKSDRSFSVQIINYLQPNISIARSMYGKALLESVMDATEHEYGRYKINVVSSNLTPQRKKQEMIKGDNINLIWTTQDSNSIEELLKVPFHTMKGVLGYRALIIKADRQDEFSKITNLQQLQLMRPGQVELWTDTEIYKKNNFDVATSNNMPALFPMLENGRFDFLPLGASEVNKEYLLIRLKYRSLAIETELLIKYSLHMFFMVSPTQPILAERLEKGLLAIEESGEFDRIFNQFVQPEMDSIKMQNRRVINLSSP